ncbi:MAG: ROK family protein, partial [Planctomycetes bacterium]|nr:ROK family protein [Planctomycetota bacterium]
MNTLERTTLPSTVIGIDIGGTRTRVGVVGDECCIVAKSDFPTPASGGRSALVGRLAEHIKKLHGPLAGEIPLETPIGIAVPGLVNSATGLVTRSVNLPFLEGASIRDLLPAERAGAAFLLTDIEAATWAEYRAHGEAVARFVHLRIGTGVGCGMIAGGSYVQPRRAVPGHADVLIVDDRPDAPSCTCGRRGCL